MIRPAWVERYLEVPYVRLGRTLAGADCFGLVRLVLVNEAGIEIPSYDWVNPQDRQAIRAARESESIDLIWAPVPAEKAQAFDVVPMTREHVGIMVSPDHILHTASSECGPACVPINSPEISRRLFAPLRRHRTLCRT